MTQQSKGRTLHYTEDLRLIRQVQKDQLEDLQVLCTYAQYCIGVQSVGIDKDEAAAFKENLNQITVRQEKRYKSIDTTVAQNFKAFRKEETTDDLFVVYGKKIRMLESGLRTLRLFLTDVVDVLTVKSGEQTRVSDRLGYFEKRSMELEAEMLLLQEETAKLY